MGGERGSLVEKKGRQRKDGALKEKMGSKRKQQKDGMEKKEESDKVIKKRQRDEESKRGRKGWNGKNEIKE